MTERHCCRQVWKRWDRCSSECMLSSQWQ